jgi:hypothetical protein
MMIITHRCCNNKLSLSFTEIPSVALEDWPVLLELLNHLKGNQQELKLGVQENKVTIQVHPVTDMLNHQHLWVIIIMKLLNVALSENSSFIIFSSFTQMNLRNHNLNKFVISIFELFPVVRFH